MLYDKRWETEPVKIPAIKPRKPREKPKPLDWRQIILKAAAIIEKHGWCRGHYQRSGRYCAMGAVHKAAGYQPSGPEMLPLFGTEKGNLNEAKANLFCVIGDVTQWNDSYARNGQEVISTLRSVAKAKM